VALEEVFEKELEPTRPEYVLFYFLELLTRQFPPAQANRRPIPQAVQKEFGFPESEAHVAGEADKEYAVHSIVSISALAADSMWSRDKATFFIVANGRGIDAGPGGEP
jgi:hypothetical protein